jgi:hypothetical protein
LKILKAKGVNVCKGVSNTFDDVGMGLVWWH